MKRLLIPCLLLLSTACAATRPVATAPAVAPPVVATPSAGSPAPAGTIRVTGRAHHEVAPDQATITVGVHDRARTARAATDANNEHMARLVAALRSHGIAERDIQTSTFQVNEDYDARGRVNGFVVTNLVTITVADLPRTGEILDAAVSAGASQIHGVSFGLADPHGSEQQALEQAMADARKRGEVLAKSAAGSLGDVIGIDTVYAPTFQPRVFGSLAEGADVPISPGRLESDVEVTVLFALRA
jgi:uncharacterized protein YggE